MSSPGKGVYHSLSSKCLRPDEIDANPPTVWTCARVVYPRHSPSKQNKILNSLIHSGTVYSEQQGFYNKSPRCPLLEVFRFMSNFQLSPSKPVVFSA